jgi:thioredoxin reductase
MPAEVVVVGGGPSGLAAAVALRRGGVERVIVLEREAHAGGVPRHCDHSGFGLKDLHRLMSGPRYAASLRAQALAAGACLREGTMATDWGADGALAVTSPAGREWLRPDAVVLATGCRERPSSARRVAGSRPAGVLTTGALQQLVHLDHRQVGTRAVVVGAEHVSFSAIDTLHRGGAKTVALTTELPHHQSLAVFALGARLRYGVPVWTGARVAAIRGTERVEGVELEDLATGARRTVACDCLVFSADWIPDHELAVTRGCRMEHATRGPAVDSAGRTSARGVVGGRERRAPGGDRGRRRAVWPPRRRGARRRAHPRGAQGSRHCAAPRRAAAVDRSERRSAG